MPLVRPLIVALALCSFGLAHAAAPLSPQEARARLEAGDRDALEGLRAWTEAHPEDVEAYRLLGVALAGGGDVEGCLAVLEAGAALPGGGDLGLLAAQVHFQRAEDGPYVTRTAGTVSYRPHDGTQDEAAWHDRELDAVIRLLLATWDQPRAEVGALRLLPQAQYQRGQPEAAQRSLDQLTERFPQDATVWTDLGDLRLAMGMPEAALLSNERALALQPESAHAHEQRAYALEQTGRVDQAELHHKMARYYDFLSPFTGVPFSEATAAQVQDLAGHFARREAGAPAEGDHAAAALDALGQDPSGEATSLLLAFVWHHSHDALEDRAWELIQARPDTAPALILQHLGEVRSTCTLGSCARTLVKLHDPAAFDTLARLLPMERSAGMYIGIADALDTLGDPRAVPLLVAELHAAPLSGDENLLASMGAIRARHSAVLALGAFDTPEARDALLGCTEDPEVRLACHAALYRLTGDRAHLKPIREAIKADKYVGLEVHYLREKAGVKLRSPSQ